MKGCPSRKVGHSSLANARVAAHSFARELNRSGTYSEDMYAYRCSACRRWHTTHAREWGEHVNVQVFEAPSRELQDWAMGERVEVPHGTE